jgi:pyruvate kinase
MLAAALLGLVPDALAQVGSVGARTTGTLVRAWPNSKYFDSPKIKRNELERLLRAGVDVVRLNLSHGDLPEHLVRLAAVRDAADLVGRPVAVLADLPGPKIRAGRFPEGGVELPAGSYVRVVTGDQMSDAGTIVIDHPGITDGLVAGDRIVLGDGAISLTVYSPAAGGVVARVDTGGRTQGSPGVHLSSERLALTTPTEEDLELAEAMASAFAALGF